MRSFRTFRGGWGMLAAVVLALALAAPALAASFTVRINTSHQPHVGRNPITVTVTRGRVKLSGRVYYRFLFGGQVVPGGTRAGGSFKHGVWHDTLKFPPTAIGYNLTIQVVVTTRYGTVYAPWWIKVRR